MSTVYQIVTDRIISALQAGVVPWRRPWHTEPARNLISGRPYRGVNVLLLESASYECRHWLTFNQARSLGGSVRKGERGTPVVFWKTYDREHADGDDERRFVLRYYTVFNLSQCEGIAAPPAAPRPAFDPIEACERIVTQWVDRPLVFHGGSQAFYSPARDVIHMPSREAFSSEVHYYATLFHEVTHATGASHRLARRGVIDPIAFGSHGYSIEELTAEIGASFLAAEAGISAATIDNSAAYIAHWSKRLRDEPRWIVSASAAAAKAADLILGRAASASAETEVAA